MANRFTKVVNQDYASSYGQLPLDALIKLGAIKEAKNEKSAAEEDAIINSILSLKSTKMDQPHAKELVNSYLGQLDTWHNKYKNNLEAGSEELRGLKRKLIMDQTQGKWNTIANRYAAEQEAIKAHKSAEEEYIKSGGTKGTHPDDVDLSLNYTIANQDPLDKVNKWGELPGYKSHTLLPSTDLNALGLELAKEVSPQVIQRVTGLTDIGDYMRDGKIKTESLPADALSKLVKYSLMTNDKARAYNDWKNKINGNQSKYNLLAQNNFSDGINSYNPEYVQDELLFKDINEAANQAGMLKSVNNRLEDYNYREDWRDRDAAKNRLENPRLDFIFPGAQFGQTSDIKNIEDLTKHIQDSDSLIQAKEKDLQTKIASGEYSDVYYIQGKKEEIAIAKEKNRRLQLTKDNAFAKETAKLTSAEKKDYDNYLKFQETIKNENLNLNEYQTALNQNPSAAKGAGVAAKISSNVNKNIELEVNSAVSPNLVYQGTKKELELMDNFVDRAWKTSNVYSLEGSMMTPEEKMEFESAEYNGYTQEPLGNSNKFGIKLKNSKGEYKRVYMEAPLNFNSYKQSVDPNNTLTTQLIIQQVKDIKDDPKGTPSGKIVMGDSKNYGEVIIPNRLPNTDQDYSVDPNEVLWKAPDGIKYKMNAVEIAKTIELLKNMKK